MFFMKPDVQGLRLNMDILYNKKEHAQPNEIQFLCGKKVQWTGEKEGGD
jgi:hypothetical protein